MSAAAPHPDFALFYEQMGALGLADAIRREAAPELGNTGAGTSPSSTGLEADLGDLVPSNRCRGGVDTLEASVWVRRGDEFAVVRERLDWLQLQAADSGESYWTIGGETLIVSPGGKRLGGAYYNYVVTWNQCRFYIRSGKQSVHLADVYVVMGSLPLMQYGYVESWRGCLAVLRSLALFHESHKVSRVDVCVDLPDVRVDVFEEKLFERAYVTRAKHKQTFETDRDFTGVVFDGAGCRLRIYDKMAETSGPGIENQAKRAVLVAKRWGGKLPKNATRVEFQLRREKLREKFNVDTIEQLSQYMRAIVEWCVGDWFRFTAQGITKAQRDANNQSRVATWGFWSTIGDYFVSWLEVKESPAIVPRANLVPRVEHLKRGIVGMLKSVAALSDLPLNSSKEFAYAMGSFVSLALRGSSVVELQQRREKFEQMGASAFAGVLDVFDIALAGKPLNEAGEGTLQGVT